MGPTRKSSPPTGELRVAPTSLASEGRYRIQVVAEKTGVPSATLRAWERRYGIPTPARTESSYRLYSDHDVELVRALNAFCAAGMAPAEAARRVREASQAPLPEPSAPRADPFEDLIATMMDAVVRFDPDALDAVIAQAMTLGSASAIFEHVVAPVQREIGERWHAGTLTVAQEHFATASLTAAVHSLHRLVQPSGAERTVLLACFADEEHTLPLYGIAFRLTSWGYRTIVLGARTPPSAVDVARRAIEPDLIGLSLTVGIGAARAAELVDAYADACGSVPWVVGGSGARSVQAAVESAGGSVLTHDEPTRARFEQTLAAGRRPRGPR